MQLFYDLVKNKSVRIKCQIGVTAPRAKHSNVLHTKFTVRFYGKLYKRGWLFKLFKQGELKLSSLRAGLSLKKLASLAMIAGLLIYSAVFAIGTANAFFTDAETSTENIFSMGSLDFSLDSASDFAPDIAISDSERSITVVNDGTLDFQYRAQVTDAIGGLCASLNLTAFLDGSEEYSGALSGFDVSPFVFADPEEWDFTLSLTSSAVSLQDTDCAFNFQFDAWQIELAEGAGGFTDQEIIANTVTAQTDPIVLNEFLPNPSGDDDAAMPAGEWVELYNYGSIDWDVDSWVLYDSLDTQPLVISTANSDNNNDTGDSGETIVPAGGYLVVYLDGTYAPGWLNNTDGDSVRLYDAAIGSGGALIDSHAYVIDADPDKSFARIPDGGAWVDPVPTPGKPNILVLLPIALNANLPTAATETAVTEEVTEEDVLENLAALSEQDSSAEELSEQAPSETSDPETTVEPDATTDASADTPATEEILVDPEAEALDDSGTPEEEPASDSENETGTEETVSPDQADAIMPESTVTEEVSPEAPAESVESSEPPAEAAPAAATEGESNE